jgi:hypothetical protein
MEHPDHSPRQEPPELRRPPEAAKDLEPDDQAAEQVKGGTALKASIKAT